MLVRTTAALGTTAPVESVTVPRMSAVVSWQKAAELMRNNIVRRRTGFLIIEMSAGPGALICFAFSLCMLLCPHILLSIKQLPLFWKKLGKRLSSAMRTLETRETFHKVIYG